jgi:hypothetical protein
MFALVCLMVWELHPLLVSPLIALFGLELLLLSSNLRKVPGEAQQASLATALQLLLSWLQQRLGPCLLITSRLRCGRLQVPVPPTPVSMGVHGSSARRHALIMALPPPPADGGWAALMMAAMVAMVMLTWW